MSFPVLTQTSTAVIDRLTDAAPLPILFRPCSWCSDRAYLDALNLAYPRQVSHTMCARCLDAFETTGTVKA